MLTGIIFHKKKKKIISIWDALEKTGEGQVRDIEVDLGLSREFILSGLQHINAQQGTYYVYRSDGTFSINIFILLLVIFWPAAIIYLLVKKGSAAKKSVETLKQFSRENLQNPGITSSESSS